MSFLFDPLPHTEATARIATLPLFQREMFDELLPELKAYAFTITGLDSFDQLARARDLLAAVPAGEKTWDKAKKEIAAEIGGVLGGKEAQARSELLLRTHTFRAYAVSRYRTLMAQRDVFSFWQYKTHGDGRVRPSHAALGGKIFPAGHPIWQRIFPPWDWGCRCLVVPMMGSEVNKLKDGEQDKAPEAKRVYDGGLADAIHTAERLPAGESLLTSNTWGASPWSEPGTVQHTWKLIQDRYKDQPEVLKAFKAWAKKTKIPEQKRTVWTWVNGPRVRAKKIKAPEVPAVPEVTTPAFVFPDSLGQLSVVKKLGGSTGAELVEDAAGNRFVRKRGASPNHLREEVLADEIYRGMGALVPEVKLYEQNGVPVKLARFIEGKSLNEWLGKSSAAEKLAMNEKLAAHFHADVLLGNWDVVGLSMDNVLVDAAGLPWRIDNGGSLRFRAMGKLKGDDWNEFPDELWTLRDAALNAQTAQIFGKARLVEIARNLEGLDLPDVPMPPEVRAMLEKRLGHLRDVGTKALDMENDGWRDSYTDEMARHLIGLRKAGITTTLPKELKQAVGAVDLVDENGVPWDDLRAKKTAASKAPTTVKGDVYAAPLIDAAKTLNFHGSKGDFQFNQTKVNAALALKSKLEAAAAGKGQDAAMAKHYLASLSYIESAAQAAGNKKLLTIPNLSAYTPKVKKAPAPVVPTGSLVQRLEAYIQANGGKYAPITEWKGSQAGNSWNTDAQAMKAWVAKHMNIPAKDVFWRHGIAAAQKALTNMEARHGAEAVNKAFTIHHAFMQDLLGKTTMRHNDSSRRVMRLVRTEDLAVIGMNSLKPGVVSMSRGLCESASPFRVTTAYGSEVTIQAVPHSKILGFYGMEKTPGAGDCGFYNDGENEITFIGAGVNPFTYLGTASKVKTDMDAGEDADKWGIPLDYLRS